MERRQQDISVSLESYIRNVVYLLHIVLVYSVYYILYNFTSKKINKFVIHFIQYGFTWLRVQSHPAVSLKEGAYV